MTPWIAILYGSGDFPDMRVEILSTCTEGDVRTANIKLPDGTIKEVDLIAFIDWSSDWYNPEGIDSRGSTSTYSKSSSRVMVYRLSGWKTCSQSPTRPN